MLSISLWGRNASRLTSRLWAVDDGGDAGCDKKGENPRPARLRDAHGVLPAGATRWNPLLTQR